MNNASAAGAHFCCRNENCFKSVENCGTKNVEKAFVSSASQRIQHEIRN